MTNDAIMSKSFLERSEVNRCLCRLPHSITDMIKDVLVRNISNTKKYTGSLVFNFFRYLEVFAFQARLYFVFFGENIIDAVQEFSLMVAHFSKLFHDQRKKRYLLPMYRCDSKKDLRKTFIQYRNVKSSLDDVFFLEKIFEQKNLVDFLFDFENIQYLVVFIYNLSHTLDPISKTRYFEKMYMLPPSVK
jgi:hypothetical protein